MCHDHFHRSRAWDRETVDNPLDADEADADSDTLPSFLAEEEPDEDLEVLTDGGDE